jgi:hypothetical protein
VTPDALTTDVSERFARPIGPRAEEPTLAQPLRNRLLRRATKCHTCTRGAGERASAEAVRGADRRDQT